MKLTVLSIAFSAGNGQGAEDFIKLLVDNVNNTHHTYHIERQVVKTTHGPEGEYYIGQLWLHVDAANLNEVLVQIDTVKDGFIPNSAAIYEHIFKDVRVEVARDSIDSVAPVLAQNEYMLNKIQEQARTIENLESQVFNLTKLSNGFQQQINFLTERFNEHHAFLHDFIDFKNLIRVIREIAEKVDDEILDNYPLQKVH